MALAILGDKVSGNCLKVLWTARHLGLDHQWRDIDIMKGESRTSGFLALNPAGQVPVLLLDDGRALAQSNAILLYLAEGSALIPADAYARALMLEWMFWEQYSHEPYIGVARFQMKYLGKAKADLDPKLFERGAAALTKMENALTGSAFLVVEDVTLADIALVAYTRMAHDGGFDLAVYPAVKAWIERVETALHIQD